MYPVLEHRPVWIEVDTEQLRKNLTYIKTRAAGTDIWAVVKSDAYNHGIDALFSHFIAEGIHHFCVGNYDEALQLQQLANEAEQEIELLIFGVVPLDKIETIADNWSITISSSDYLTRYEQALTAIPHKTVNVQLKIDSGMNRRGFKTKEEFRAAWTELKNNQQINIVGLYTHFSTADTDISFMRKQVKQFVDICGNMLEDVRYVHAQNSYGLLNLAEEANFFNVLRVGGLCYGLSGTGHVELTPIFSLYGEVIELKAVSKGETISYGNTYTFEHDGYVGVVPLGYADGFRRSNTTLSVSVNGKRATIVGRVCMEQLMIFAQTPLFEVGDTVEFIGAENDLFAVAEHNSVSDYELVCGFLSRVPRRYINTRKGD